MDLRQCCELNVGECPSWLAPYKAQGGSWRLEERISPDQPCNARRDGHEASLEHIELAGDLQQVEVNGFTSVLGSTMQGINLSGLSI